MTKNLILTGMMGVGKSTIGKSLAKKLSFNFIDIDNQIEKHEGCSINIIFKSKSESYFRALEKKITLNELSKSSSVISLGGGAFLDSEIRQFIKKKTISFWLDVDTSILIRRLNNSKKRPLLLGKNLTETVKKIYLDRRKTYNEADFRIKCKSLKPVIITNKILELYENASS